MIIYIKVLEPKNLKKLHKLDISYLNTEEKIENFFSINNDYILINKDLEKKFFIKLLYSILKILKFNCIIMSFENFSFNEQCLMTYYFGEEKKLKDVLIPMYIKEETGELLFDFLDLQMCISTMNMFTEITEQERKFLYKYTNEFFSEKNEIQDIRIKASGAYSYYEQVNIAIDKTLNIMKVNCLKYAPYTKNLFIEEGIVHLQALSFIKVHVYGTLTLPSSIQKINKDAFFDCSFNNVIIKKNLKGLPKDFFKKNKVRSVRVDKTEVDYYKKLINLSIEDKEAIDLIVFG